MDFSQYNCRFLFRVDVWLFRNIKKELILIFKKELILIFHEVVQSQLLVTIYKF